MAHNIGMPIKRKELRYLEGFEIEKKPLVSMI